MFNQTISFPNDGSPQSFILNTPANFAFLDFFSSCSDTGSVSQFILTDLSTGNTATLIGCENGQNVPSVNSTMGFIPAGQAQISFISNGLLGETETADFNFTGIIKDATSTGGGGASCGALQTSPCYNVVDSYSVDVGLVVAGFFFSMVFIIWFFHKN